MSLVLSEYSNWVNSPNSDLRVPQEPALAIQIIDASAATQSAVFNVATKFVRVSADSNAYRILFGANPTASASTGIRFAATQVPEFFGVSGSNMRAAAISTA